MGLYGIEDLGAFTEEEREHIRSLYLRKRELWSNNRGRPLKKSRKEELDALEWVFVFLSEISEEE